MLLLGVCISGGTFPATAGNADYSYIAACSVTIREYTRYRVSVDGEVNDNLPKRRTAHRIIKALIEAGACPAALQSQISWKPIGLKADGRLSDEEMCEHITARGTTRPNRWFTADNELVFHEDATYAILNQWGGRTVEAMDKLLASHKSQHITYQAI